MKNFYFSLQLCALLLVAPVSLAHHSASIYNQDREIKFEGVVTRLEWANPHIFIHVEGEADGKPSTVWEFETSNPSIMTSRGWSRDMLKPGDKITIGGAPGRNPRRSIGLLTLLEKDGVDLLNEDSFFGARFLTEDEVQPQTESLSGQWVIAPTEEIYSVFKHENLSLTDKAKLSIENFDEVSMSPQVNCIPSVAPSYMFIPDVKVIEIGEEISYLRSEYQGVVREFYMKVDSHEGIERSLHGHSIAHWEGDVLVVDTSLFSDNRNGHGIGLASGSQKHLVEEFELNADRSSMTYRFMQMDPEYINGPISGEAQSVYRPDREYSPVECSLESAQRFFAE